MPPVFGHGRLRLYLLKLLAEAPRHGYEVIRLLEERFQGLYAPSAGTVYPRLAKLAAEGLVTHTEEGGRKVYSLTAEGERELAAREAELTQLEREIRESLAALAADIREDVSGSAHDLRQEVRQATAAARTSTETAAGRAAWAAQARRAKEESRRARREAKQAQEATEAARHRFEEAARRIHDRVQSHANAGDWSGAIREGLEGLSGEIGGWSRYVSPPSEEWQDDRARGPGRGPEQARAEQARAEQARAEQTEEPRAERVEEPWAKQTEEPWAKRVEEPVRELERLLDKFRDDVRDAARDHGVSRADLAEARRHLSTAAAHLVAMLRSPHG
ncbi:PadR family transcriptional regulator [Streptomyces marincola]|uniref:PadR family transcriptional regulator n=1 Tax=Streptomyces marincola TaxID=2878388 RepID=A0A1W7CV65_9ACTN|nr:PadR family transcriptional regulator [Streptomyces marincola]ARQ68586.1 PadR family transcriptional regulator [Streptomyces marincola]